MRARAIANPLLIGPTVAISFGIVGHVGVGALWIPGIFKGSEPIDHPTDGNVEEDGGDIDDEEEETHYKRRMYGEYNEEMYEAIMHDEEGGGDWGEYRAEDGDANHDMEVTFVNEFPNISIDVYWEGGEDVDEFGNTNHVRKFEGTISPRGGSLSVNTNEGHEFSYDHDGERHYITLNEPNAYGDQLVVLAGHVREGFLVRCDLKQRDDASSHIGPLEIMVNPYWAPRGASRFMELVRRGYYDGTALNRVVPNFLVQFGISRDIHLRDEYAGLTIFDDMPNQFKFQPGFVSFAGSGHDSRTTEIFIVMPGTPQEQLDYFGENSWETPFGIVVGDAEHRVLTEIYSGYGDMSSMGGKGPDSSRIYDADGYDYLHDEFPLLDYIDRCFIVDEESSALVEEEL